MIFGAFKLRVAIIFAMIFIFSIGVFFISFADGWSEAGERQGREVESAEAGPVLFEVIWQRRVELTGQLIEHIRLTVFAMALAVSLGVGTGIFLTRFRRLSSPVLGLASVIQTIPSLALLALMIPLLGIGVLPAVVALFLYALLPIMRNTYTAIEEVDPAIIEVGRGMGMTGSQILLRVEIPLCIPIVMAGIRTSMVICVGIATLCTFIGGGGLGEMIMRGMQTKGSALIFAGVIPAILLALSLDGLVALGQGLLTPRGLKISKAGASAEAGLFKKVLSAGAICLLLGGLAAAVFVGETGDVVVGSKHFTEQKILGEMVAQLIESHTDLKVRRRLGLQGTKVCFSALKEGDLDMYVEYTGTALVNILDEQYDSSKGRGQILEEVRREFRERWGLKFCEPLGFDNTYTLAMRGGEAEKLGVEKISQLSAYSDELKAGFDHEFTTRPEYKRFEEVYGYMFEDITYLDPDLMYKALQGCSVDVIDAFATDGRIASYDIRVLEDDRNLFPPYDACIVVSEEALNEFAGLGDVLEKLSGMITAEQMRKMNYAVTDKLKTPAAVAKEFLKSEGLL